MQLIYKEHKTISGREMSVHGILEINLMSKKVYRSTWWRNQVETFSTLLAISAGHSPVTGELCAQRPVTRSFHIYFDLRLCKRLSKQWRGWWFETPSRPLWRDCNDLKSKQATIKLVPNTKEWCYTEL